MILWQIMIAGYGGLEVWSIASCGDAKVWGIGLPQLTLPRLLNFENFFLIHHICYYVQVISIEEGGWLLIQLYGMCIFIYIKILKVNFL